MNDIIIRGLLLKDVTKKRIPRAEFHEIFLDFVESGIAHKVESPCFCLAEITNFPLYGQYHKFKIILWNSARGIRFLGTSIFEIIAATF